MAAISTALLAASQALGPWDTPERYRPMPRELGPVCDDCWMRFGWVMPADMCPHHREAGHG
jgi:hypothetical protein